MIVLPITGYLGASYSKAGVRWFGLATPRWTLPTTTWRNSFSPSTACSSGRWSRSWRCHVLGALKRLLLDQDQVFQRMWFKWR